MKANELMIGNYVNVPNAEQCPFRIDAFEYCSEKFIKVAQEVKINGAEVHPLTWYGGDLQPIPLTEEWLLKFGFEWKGLISKGRYLTIFTPCGKALVFKDNYFIFAGVTIETQIQYVHQLQNLYFALTGEELTFKSE
jgi:hypothetical protein